MAKELNLTDNYKPLLMMVMYTSLIPTKGGYNNFGNNVIKKHYLETSPMHDGKPTAFTPLSTEMANEIATALITTSRKETGGKVPKNLLYVTFGASPTLIWETPPQIQRILYSKTLVKEGYLKLHIPGLIWKLNSDRRLQLFAIKEPVGDQEFDKVVLYKPPFSNINEHGNVCLGSGSSVLESKFSSFSKIITAVESAFWGTYFTHQSVEKAVKGNLITLHKKLDKSGDEFPLDVLLEVKNNNFKTLKALADEKQEDTDTFEEQDDEEPEEGDDAETGE